MDERIARTIRRLANWDELRQFETNARDSEQLTDEIVGAIEIRTAELGRALIAEKTGLQVTDLSETEQKIVQAASEYVGVMKLRGKQATRTLGQLRNRGLIDAAEISVCKPKLTQGFLNLVDADLEDLSYERIVVDHPDEFSPRAIWFSRRTLGMPNASDSPPANTHSDTQTRTATLLRWLKSEAEGNMGIIPPFTNADAAEVMGIGDMRRFGRAHGRIQSRIDFACYLRGMPPLGLVADIPFARAWDQEGRGWPFPVAEMRAAAQARIWSDDDFDRILEASATLPAHAHITWNEAFATDSPKIKAWADGFIGASAPIRDEEQASKRNSAWARDELILALDLYLRHRAAPPGKGSPEVKELSDFLNKMGTVLGLANTDTFRNVNGVYMKMMNFMRLDPEYTTNGKVGLTRGNKDEEVVWVEFSADTLRLAAVVRAIRLAVDLHGSGTELRGADEPDIQEADEGRVLTRLHRVRERSRKLVELCKQAASKKHGGRLFCQACGFDFSEKYGVAGAGLIDVHHTKPVHTLVEGDKTRLEDLALLCANCHRVVHSSRKWLTVEQVKAAILC